MASVQAFIAVRAPRARVFGIVRDLGQRERILPDGWRFRRFLTEERDRAGSAIEIEARVGPGQTVQVVQVQVIEEDATPVSGKSRLVESPPTADNYITTWTLAEEADETLVGLHTEFSYGGMVGEFFVKRQLRKAYAQMLAKLKAVAEEAG